MPHDSAITRRVLRVPKGGRLRAHLLGQIETGGLAPGDAILAERQLASLLQLSRGTVRQTLGELEQQGIVRRIQGKGTFVTADGASLQSAADAVVPVAGTAGDNLHSKRDKLTGILALVLPEVTVGPYPLLVRGFSSAAGNQGHQVLVCNTDNDNHKQADIILQLLDKRVAGIAIVPPTTGRAAPHQIRQLQSSGIPVVYLHRAIEGATAPVVALSHRGIGSLAATALAEAGHRNIAFFASHESPSVLEYLAGFRAALQEKGLSLRDELIHLGRAWNESVSEQQHEQDVEVALKQMLALPADRRPTAIFDPGDPQACLMYLLLTKFGLSVPRDISLMTFGGANRPPGISRRLAAVVVDEEVVGQIAVTMLDEMSRKQRAIDDGEQRLIPFSVHRGETLGPPPATSVSKIS